MAGVTVAALRADDAAQYLGLSRRTFYRRAVPHLKKARVGACVTYPVKELDRLLDALTE